MKPRYCDLLPIPNLLETTSILFVQPHPDDLEIGAGATMARLAHSGCHITCLTITDGSVGTYDRMINPEELAKTRRHEAEKGAAMIGIKNMIWLDFPDGGNLPYEEVRAEVTKVIRELKPSAVLTCDPWLPYEVHSDHIRSGMAAAEAAFLAPMPYFCPEDLQEGLQPHSVEIIGFYYTAYPNTFIDVARTWELKLSAIDCHKSQFAQNDSVQFKAYLTAKAMELGKEHGCEMVELLKVLSPRHLHIFEDAWRC
jgi:N,N'-diacetylchitobiose non-reducing end deacetylase